MDCWHENIYSNMLKALEKRPLLSTYQGQLLKDFIDSIKIETCLDIGCGTGQVSQLIEGMYNGCDIPEIVQNVSEKSGFEGMYMGMDMEKFNGNIARNYDLVIMSAFIDVMQQPEQMLKKILNHCTKYVIIHRQELTDGDTSVTKEQSYGGFTYHSKINTMSFYGLLKDFEIIKQASCKYPNWGNGGYSCLLQKKEK